MKKILQSKIALFFILIIAAVLSGCNGSDGSRKNSGKLLKMQIEKCDVKILEI